MNYMDQYKFWLEDSYFDEGTKEELRKIADNQAEIEDRFYKDLAFGTGGLRGVIGAGTNRMNIYTVRKATQGLANYILKQGGAEKGVAIAYDSRYYSPEFADEAALCMAANGIKAYVFDELRPTPELSFALRTLGCISGIVVTASHNPPEYNGYKVYWEDGAQVTAPKDHEIIDEVEHVTDFHTVKTMSKDDAIEAGLYQYIGEEIDVAYMEELKKQILATDPDADRLGIYAKDSKSGEYMPFTGNMSGMLIAEYILRERTATNRMPVDPVMVSTIVTTNMAAAIAADYNVELREFLTGFKYIGEQIKWMEQAGKGHYVFGLEESYGCLAGTHARDKDAIVAVMCLCETAAWCKKHGMTCWDQMLALYEKYGYYKETQYAITLKGIDGAAQISAMMDKLRSNPPKNFGDLQVVEMRDYDKDQVKDMATGAVRPTGLPKSNVLYFELTNNSWCCARPSGTEPKIKFYMGVKGTSLEDAQAKVDKLTADLKAIL